MRNIFIILTVFLLAQFAPAKSAKAEGFIDKIPTVHAGIMYSLRDSAVNHSETFDIFSWKDSLFVELGYAGDADESDHKGIAVVSYDIKQLHLGNYVKLPLLDLVQFRPSIYIGLGSINAQDLEGSKLDYGLGATLISYKF